jgi:hypothetical protein
MKLIKSLCGQNVDDLTIKVAGIYYIVTTVF